MQSAFKDKLDHFRNSLPIGVNGAIKLLKENDGDIEKASKQFKESALKVVKEKILFEVDEQSIICRLIANNYAIDKTLDSLFEDKYSLTERILIKNKDRERALDAIVYAIEKKDNLTRNFWLELNEVNKLENHKRCLITIVEWINYDNWENFDSAIARKNWTSAMIVELKKLGLDEISNQINDALNISNQFYKIKRELTELPPIDKYESFYQKYKPLILDTLIDYVNTHIQYFP